MKPSRRRMIRLVLSHTGMAAAGLGLLLSGAMVSGSPLEQAETDVAAPETTLRVSSADGQPLGLRVGPAPDQPFVAWVAHGETVTLAGNALTVEEVRWLPIRTANEEVGWISDQHVVASLPLPDPSPSPEAALAESVTPEAALAESPPPLSSPAPLTVSVQDVPPVETQSQPGRPLEIEAKVKYPEAKSRHQEITIWVTRDGVPVPDATVTIYTDDDEDEPLRVLEPTNEVGRTRREFAIGKEKGGIELFISAVAPDGGAGRATVSYFRR